MRPKKGWTSKRIIERMEEIESGLGDAARRWRAVGYDKNAAICEGKRKVLREILEEVAQ